jgi:hypothetical protein
MPRKRIQKPCACRCGKNTAGGHFLPGHDTKTLSAVIEAVGGITALRLVVVSPNTTYAHLWETIQELRVQLSR